MSFSYNSIRSNNFNRKPFFPPTISLNWSIKSKHVTFSINFTCGHFSRRFTQKSRQCPLMQITVDKGEGRKGRKMIFLVEFEVRREANNLFFHQGSPNRLERFFFFILLFFTRSAAIIIKIILHRLMKFYQSGRERGKKYKVCRFVNVATVALFCQHLPCKTVVKFE